MKVIDHEPHFWFLFEENGRLFLDANCNHSFFGYSWMIELDVDESSAFNLKGRDYLGQLATEIQNGAPILEVTKSIYKYRNVTDLYREKVKSAIDLWKSNKTL